jgi:hypothetical protein
MEPLPVSPHSDPEPKQLPSGTKLLDELLESTLAQRGRTLSDSEWQLLRQVAARSDSSDIDFLELSTRIIEAFLLQRFPKTLNDTTGVHRMSQSISQTLCGDPSSRQRLVEFLQHLRGS